jgi:hypothetical protein
MLHRRTSSFQPTREQRLDVELRTTEPWHHVQQQALATQPVGDNLMAAFAAHAELISNLRDWLKDVADDSWCGALEVIAPIGGGHCRLRRSPVSRCWL